MNSNICPTKRSFAAPIVLVLLAVICVLPVCASSVRATSLGFVPAGLPASVDLSRFDPPALSQGTTGSCVAWAEGYYLRGWYAAKAGTYPAGGFAPMSVYSHIVAQYDGGQDKGASLAQGFQVQQHYGIDTRADYPQGDYALTLPTPLQAAHALSYKLPGYTQVFPTLGKHPLQARAGGITAVLAALAAGKPVVLAVIVFQDMQPLTHESLFDPAVGSAFLANPLVQAPTEFNPPTFGSHAVMADGYDANGIWFITSWGTQYGRNGRAELSYGYLEDGLLEAATANL